MNDLDKFSRFYSKDFLFMDIIYGINNWWGQRYHEKDFMRKKQSARKPGKETGTPSPKVGVPGYFLPVIEFYQRHSISIILFLCALFLIISISNPAMYMNDEWISANQLHQLNIGHQVTYSEGKYGVTENGTVSAYVVSRQNVLQYSLALPIASLPVTKIFGLMGDNFRFEVILLWSVIPFLVTLMIWAFLPGYSRVGRVRLPFLGLFLSLVLFFANFLLYKQFPYSAPDAPFEVAAIALTNEILFALTIALVFETSRFIFKDLKTALFGTIATIACSSYIFWAGTAKDHMLAAAVFALVIFFMVRYLSLKNVWNATAVFIFAGLLIWVRPEFGFFVALLFAIFFIALLLQDPRKHEKISRLIVSGVPLLGLLIGGIPFFLNNLLVNQNWLIPVFDLPHSNDLTNATFRQPLALNQITEVQGQVNESLTLNPVTILPKAFGLLYRYYFVKFSWADLSGLAQVMTFPANGNTGFLILCPILVIAILCGILGIRKIFRFGGIERAVFFYLLIAFSAVLLSDLPSLGEMSISIGVLPDMKYLSPAYIPAGLISLIILERSGYLGNPRMMVRSIILGAIIFVPGILILMLALAPFGSNYPGFSAFLSFMIIFGVVLACGLILVNHIKKQIPDRLNIFIAFLIMGCILTALTFQVMLTFLVGVVVKFNGYPLWIPLIREGYNLFFHVNYLPPI